MSLSPLLNGISPFSRPHFVPGGGGFVPTDIAECIVWTFGDNAPSGAVSDWPDASGNGNDPLQPSALLQPTGVNAVLNGHRVVRLNGSTTKMATATFAAAVTQPATIFVVCKRDSSVTASGNKDVIDGADINHRLAVAWDASEDFVTYAGGTPAVGGVIPTGVFSILTSLQNGSLSRGWINGIPQPGLSADSGSNDLTALLIGDAPGSFAGTQQWGGDIAEIIIYNSGLSDADINRVGNYISGWSGLTWTNI